MKTSQKFFTTFVILATLSFGCGNSSSNAPNSIPSDTPNLLVETSKVSGACSNKGLPGYFPPSCVDYYDSITLNSMKNFCVENAEFSKWLNKCPSNKIVGGCLSKITNTVTWFYGFAAIDLKERCKSEDSQWVNDKPTAEAILKV